MDEILDNVEKRGVEKGRAEGRAEGFEKGENKLALLMHALFAANRWKDASDATTDITKRNQLYKEFGIQ